MQIADGGGVVRLHDNDLVLRKQGYETYGVTLDDPTSARGETRWTYGLERGDWSVLSKTETRLTADAADFIIEARLRAWEGDALIFEETWNERIPRDHM